MKKIGTWMVSLSLSCWLLACGGSSVPAAPTDIALSDSGVLWVDASLQTEITALVLDEDGEPMANILISLTHDGQYLDVDPASASSGEDGAVVFSVGTQNGGPVAFQAVLGGEELGDSLEVDFALQLGLVAGDMELTSPGGLVVLTASVADANGVVEGVPLLLVSDRAEDVVDPAEIDSDAGGEATFAVTSMASGSAMLTLSVGGLTLLDNPSVAVDFVGPTLSGRWSFPQPDAVLVAPRIGAVWVDMEDPFGEPVERELVSIPLGETPELGSSGTFELTLPMHVPEADLFRPDPDDPDLHESFMIAPYGIGIYDDLDGSGDFSNGEVLVAMSDEDVLLTYAVGELPEPEVVPDVVHGYQYLDLFTEQSHEIILLDALVDQHDLDIRMAPCPSGQLFGQVDFGVNLPAGSDTRVAVLMIDAHLLGLSGEEIFNGGNFFEMVSEPLAYVSDTVVDYELTLPEPSAVFPGYQDMLVQWAPELPGFGVFFPLVYVDSDGDGLFSNDDDDIHTGDTIAGFPSLPFGYGHVLIEWIDGSMPLFMGFTMRGINEGYNIVREPIKVGIDAVIDDNCLQVHEDLESGHTDLPFRIERDEAGETVVLMEGTDLYTDAGQANRVCSSSGGFLALVQVGDNLVITNQIEKGEILDLDSPIDLMTW